MESEEKYSVNFGIDENNLYVKNLNHDQDELEIIFKGAIRKNTKREKIKVLKALVKEITE